MSEGMEVIFRIALALLTMGKEELLLQDMEGVIKYFQKFMPAHFEANQEAVFKLAFEININQKKMKKLEKEYTTMKTKEKEDEIEIRVSINIQTMIYCRYCKSNIQKITEAEK